jgi:hypothetical protein
MFYVTYMIAELRRRLGRTILTAQASSRRGSRAALTASEEEKKRW